MAHKMAYGTRQRIGPCYEVPIQVLDFQNHKFEGVCVVHTHVILAPGAWNLGLEVSWMARFRFSRFIQFIRFRGGRAPAQSSRRLVFEQPYRTLGTFGRKMGPRNPENGRNFKGGVQVEPKGSPQAPKEGPNPPKRRPKHAQGSPNRRW